jgi:hypothetical protein
VHPLELVSGVRQTLNRSREVKGESMLFMTLEDLRGTPDAFLSSPIPVVPQTPCLVLAFHYW